MPRKPKSGWSGKNKLYVTELEKEGLITSAGLAAIEIAKKNGNWNKLDHVEAAIVPEDLEKALAKSKIATTYFDSLGKTNRFYLLHWLNSAKREETRKIRIATIMEALREKKMPDRFVRKPKEG